LLIAEPLPDLGALCSGEFERAPPGSLISVIMPFGRPGIFSLAALWLGLPSRTFADWLGA
jgi:hypothetical protein